MNALEIENLSFITKRYFHELYPIILLCLNLGLAKSEIIPLTWGCINFDSKKITIEKIYSKGQIIAPRRKSKREIDLPENIATELLKFKRRAKCDFSRLGQNDTILQSADLNNQFLRLVKEAKIRKIWFSDLRDTYICKLLRENVSFSYICEQLGLEGIMFLKKKYKRIIDENPTPT